MVERSIFVASCVCAFVACAPGTPTTGNEEQSVATGEQPYTFSRCPAVDGTCPRYGTIVCASRSIAEKHGACAVDSDCAPVAFDGQCTGLGSCPPPIINEREAASFRAEVSTEISAYCATNGGCAVAGLCAFPRDLHPACISGHCDAR